MSSFDPREFKLVKGDPVDIKDLKFFSQARGGRAMGGKWKEPASSHTRNYLPETHSCPCDTAPRCTARNTAVALHPTYCAISLIFFQLFYPFKSSGWGVVDCSGPHSQDGFVPHCC